MFLASVEIVGLKGFILCHFCDKRRPKMTVPPCRAFKSKLHFSTWKLLHTACHPGCKQSPQTRTDCSLHKPELTAVSTDQNWLQSPQTRTDCSQSPQTRTDCSEPPQTRTDAWDIAVHLHRPKLTAVSLRRPELMPKALQCISTDHKYCSQSPQTITDCTESPQTITDHSQSPQTRTDCSQSPQTTTDCSQSPQTTTDTWGVHILGAVAAIINWILTSCSGQLRMIKFCQQQMHTDVLMLLI